MPRGIIKLFIVLLLFTGFFPIASCSSIGNAQAEYSKKEKHREKRSLRVFKLDDRRNKRLESKNKTLNDYDRKQEQMDKEAKKAYKKDLKNHEKMQSKSTRKMMRQTSRHAKKFNKSKRK